MCIIASTVVETTCLSMRFMFSGAHRVRFSGVYGNIHGHNYDITIRLCVNGRRTLIMDIDKVRHEIQGIISAFDGKYIKSMNEETRELTPNEYVEIPCIPEGATGECLAWYLMDKVLDVLRNMGISEITETQVVVCDSPINCFESSSLLST
ncbi:hypothetical protein VMUT_1861 [Vulcanisaeta moutnovskia 768-28]|uniref:6-pyruvoyltetrahydropterin synthase n=1 Tax=Vulcanisaeta moutnovskia (strain 768-28) TaxID=985053 RepID=F0QVG0_VULM7|nr:6-carboxytetrahydropterin synthase [Vulcanisaeta moutnovskia]ADY02062.1 hypothetical protein VMUT_1861 [Vulcanisaeta moutnovskia 768-28]